MLRQSTSEDTSLEAIRRDWDARARENPRAYINWPDIANEEGAFFISGREDYERYLNHFSKKMDFDPSNKVALEIGCGIGRLARWVRRTSENISALMFRRRWFARRLLITFLMRCFARCLART